MIPHPPTYPISAGHEVHPRDSRPGREGLELAGEPGSNRDVLVRGALEVDVVGVERCTVRERAGVSVAAVVLCEEGRTGRQPGRER